MIHTTGRFVNRRYRGERMPPVEWVDDEERASMFVQRDIRVADARTATPRPELATHGFTLVRHPTAITDFHDPAQIPALVGSPANSFNG